LIEARLKRRDAAATSLARLNVTLTPTKDAFASKPGIELVAGATSASRPKTGSG
jgi:hypothetical protein